MTPRASLSLFLILLTTAAHAQEKQPSRLTALKVPPVAFSGTTHTAFRTQLRAAQDRRLHGLARFSSALTPADRAQLARNGIRVLSHYTGTTYRVSVSAAAPSTMLNFKAMTLTVLQPQQKVAPEILQRRFNKYLVTPRDSQPTNYVLNADGTANLTVTFYPDVTEEQMRQVLGRWFRNKLTDQDVFAVMPVDSIVRVAAHDRVQWIDAGPVPFLPDNDLTRAALNVDVVQNFNTATGVVGGLGGNGVSIGIFDSGVDDTHGDFTGRIAFAGNGNGAHGTHVAGIAAGSGARSNGNNSNGTANGGTAFQWRGMAPQAQIFDSPGGGAAIQTATWRDFVAIRGLDISNHSYSVSFDGAYDASNQTRDQLIRGAATSNGLPIAARLQVYSAGNHGSFPNNGGEQVGYFAITKQMKNAVIVGNWNRATARINNGSSLGPAHDGRIKPDVVAPGTTITSTGPVTHGYSPNTGTSMAAPAVAGVIALLLQQWATSYGVNLDASPPWPSTMRAAIVHTATDVQANVAWFNNADGAVRAFAGPDFATGYGLVNAQAAVQLVVNRWVVQDSTLATCDTARFTFRIGAGQPELRVTLAWDDVEGNPALAFGASQLINDLDLELVPPTGGVERPWLLDQTAVDAAGNAVGDANQRCGTALNVRRAFNANPNAVFPNAPGEVAANDALPAAGLAAAGRGKDHLNNLEQVVVANPVAGNWTVRVIGFNVPFGPQRYSLVGFTPTLLWAPIAFCDRFKVLCREIFIMNFCRRYPQLCRPIPIEPVRGGFAVVFRGLDDRVVLPLDRICQYAIDCPGCGPSGRCAGMIQLQGLPTGVRAEIRDAQGRRLGSGLSQIKGALAKLPDDRELFLVLAPGRDTPINQPQHIRVAAAR
jgi:subtilisin family serine protease